jgi:triacylglycerol lipase
MKRIAILTIVLSTALAAPALAAKPVKPGGGGGGCPTLTHNPILFVHGWNSSSSTWNTMLGRFQADGWTTPELNNWSYNYSQSNATTASQIATKVDSILKSTCATKVDLISHSMGGLSTRYYVKNLGGGAKVDEWVSLGGPNHGTDTANFCFSTACSEMRVGSSFLNALNSGDETPDVGVNWRTYWSGCDEIINPDSSVALQGATNTQTACISHSALHEDAGVYAQVREAVR